MKRLALVLVFLFLAQTAFADVWLIYKTDTREVYSISPENDATIPEKGYTKEILKKNLEDIQLSYPMTYYKYQDGKFIVNIEKVKAEVDAQIAAQEEAKQETIIREKIRAMAIGQLKTEGVVIKEKVK